MVRLDGLTRKLDFDRESGLFKVEAGSVLHDLNRMLDADGVAFENLGDIDRQTVAGSVSTGTHGTGERFQNVSAQVEAFEVIAPDGSLVTIDDSEPDLLRAARVCDWRARDRLFGHGPHRSRLHDQPRRFAEAARGGAREPRRTQRRHRPLRVLRLPRHRGGALPRVAPDRRAAGAQAGMARIRAGSDARELGRPGVRGGSQDAPDAGADRREARVEGARPRDQDRRELQGLRLRAPHQVHGDGVRGSARARARADRGRPRNRHPSRAPRRVADRGPLRQGRRLVPQPLTRTGHLLRRGPPGPPTRLGALHAPRRVARARPGRPPALGQAPLPRSGGLVRRIPAVGDFQAARKRLDPDGAFANAYTDRVLGPVA